jgi:hypothetical protein
MRVFGRLTAIAEPRKVEVEVVRSPCSETRMCGRRRGRESGGESAMVYKLLCGSTPCRWKRNRHEFRGSE